MMDKPQQDDEIFSRLAGEPESQQERAPAPSRLKAKLYSSLVRRQESSGPLLSLTETRRRGHELCVFEKVWEHLPIGERAKAFNCCSICHARVLGERVERAPTYWDSCPYVAFGEK
jgi:hypothetical protein